MDRQYQSDLDLDQVARVAGVSKFHFVRSFEATYGETPMRYLTRRRIERAQDLLMRRQLEKGQMGGLGLRVDDCRKTYEELSAKGVTFLQEPSDRPYGVEAVMRDNSGNWLVLVEEKEYTPEDFAWRIRALGSHRRARRPRRPATDPGWTSSSPGGPGWSAGPGQGAVGHPRQWTFP